MKLTVLAILLSFLGSWASQGYSQTTRLSLEAKDLNIEDFFRKIEDQSEYRFFYSGKIDVERTISGRFENKLITEVLDNVLKNTDIKYEMKGRQIILSPLETFFSVEQQQQKSVSGKVTDSTGGGLPGVSVVVKGTTTGVITDGDGKYSLSKVPENAILQFSFVGMKGQEVAVGDKAAINVTLAEETIGIEEVVAVGYGSLSKRELSGSISSVKAKDIELTNAVNVNNMLQGKVAGLNIMSSTAQPGGKLSINIRGKLSPNGSNDPLYVIDGVPIQNNGSVDNFGQGSSGLTGSINRNPLNSINPNDIESVDVLKDASASAIYGSAAANGVILITTKSGKQGEAKVSYTGNYSVQTPKQFIQPLNATEFMVYHNLYMEENFKFSNKMAPYGTVDPATKTFTPFFTQQQISNAGVGMDWTDYVMRTGSIKEHNVSVSGGTSKTKYFSSLNYFDQEGLLKNSELKRFTGRVNLDQEIGSRINLKLGITYSQINNSNVATGQAHNDEPSMLQSALRFAPNFDVYDQKGDLSTSYLTRIPNPQSFLMVKNNTVTKRMLFAPKLEIKVTNELKLSFVGGVDESSADNDMYIPVGAKFQTAPEGNAQLAINKINNYNGESFLSYNKPFSKSILSVLGGIGYYNTGSTYYGMIGVGFLTDAFSSNNVGLASNKDKNVIWSGRNEQTKLSQFLRVNYSILDRYILTFNGRRDGSSIWAEGKKWGIFPGFSAAWIVSEEPYMKQIHVINNLKVRAGFGTVGNEGLGGNYSMSLYGTAGNAWRYAFGNPGISSVGIMQTQLGNPDLTWETDITINAGIDFTILNNRFSGSIDYYQRTAKDLFDWQTLPSANAIGRIGANIGSTRSSGVEIALKTINVKTSSFSWSTDLTFSSNNSYWLERNPAVALAKYVGENDPLNSVYGWKTDGLIRTKDDIPSYQSGAFLGNVKYVDLEPDGKLDINDVTYFGNTTPKAFYGFGNTFTYKGFDLNIFIYGNYGGLQWDQHLNFIGLTGAVGLAQPNPSNAEISVKDTWSSFNPNGKYPGIATDAVSSSNPTGKSDFGMYKLFFGRVRNISLGYNLPNNLLEKTNIFQSVRFFADLQNFAVFSNNKGLDPEMERNNFPYPIAKTIAFGLNVNFK